MGRDIAYDHWSCDLLCAASSPDLYRINLEQVFIIMLCLHIIFIELLLCLGFVYAAFDLYVLRDVSSPLLALSSPALNVVYPRLVNLSIVIVTPQNPGVR